MDEDCLHDILKSHKHIITVEDGVVTGGFGSVIASFAESNGYNIKMKVLGVPDEFIEHGTIQQLQQYCGIDVNSLADIFSGY